MSLWKRIWGGSKRAAQPKEFMEKAQVGVEPRVGQPVSISIQGDRTERGKNDQEDADSVYSAIEETLGSCGMTASFNEKNPHLSFWPKGFVLILWVSCSDSRRQVVAETLTSALVKHGFKEVREALL